MYCKTTVRIPSEKGKIITRKKGDAVYILFQHGAVYNREKQYAVPQRTVIGKADSGNPGYMFPNEKFQDYFPEAAIPEILPEAYRSCCLRIGSYAVIRKVLDEYGIPGILRPLFPKDLGLLLDLVAYMIVEEDNAGQYYPDFAFCHPLFSEDMQIFSDVKISRFLRGITEEQIKGFLDAWNKKRDHTQKIYISYDSTNKNSSAGDIELVEYGKAKTDKGLPIFNLAIAFDQTNRIPLFYEEYPGSITDVSQFSYTVGKAGQYGYENIGFVLDRGYFSKDNIRYMEQHGYAFIIMVKGRKDLVSSLITEHRHTFETDRSCSIRSYRVYGKTVMSKLYEDDEKERYIHIYYNPSKEAAEREELEQQIDQMKTHLEKHMGLTTEFGKPYHDLFDIRYSKKGKQLISFEERADVITKKLELCGYFCIVTSEEMTCSQALVQYKGRDISEKLFRSDKSFIGSGSMRVHSTESVKAKLFVEFIALIVRNRIYNLLKETFLRLEVRPNYMTVPAAIKELEKIEMVNRSRKRYELDHAVTKRQRIILSSFGMDEDSIREIAAGISSLLAKDQTQQGNTTGKEQNDDGEDTFNLFD